MKRTFAKGLLALFVLAGGAYPHAAGRKPYFSQYDTLIVGEFENIEAVGEIGIRPPQVALDAARRDIVQSIVDLHLFRRVNDHQDGRARGGGQGTLALTGAVESFDGKVQKGGGKGTLRLAIKIVDRQTEALLFEGSVTAKISPWVNRPHSQVSAAEVGKQVAKIIKENW